MALIDYARINRLAEQAKVGDGDARELLTQMGYTWVRRLIHVKGLTPPLGHSNDDMVQEGVKGLVYAIDHWNPDGRDFAAYAKQVITCDLLDFLTKARRKKHLLLSQALSLDASSSRNEDEERIAFWRLPDTSGLGVDPLDWYELRYGDAFRLLEAFRRPLSQREAEVLERCILGKESYRVVADDWDTHWKSVDNAVQRVKRKAADMLPMLVNDRRLSRETRYLCRQFLDLVGVKWRRVG